MIAWYPAAKLFVTLLVLAASVLLFKYKHHKLNMAWGLLWAIFLYLAPIKIDGTESHRAHQLETVQATAYHSQHTVEAIPAVTIHKLTFAERMAQEDARSVTANQRITDEISK